MNNLIDLTGKQFGRLKVLKRIDLNNKRTFWLCQCKCGIIKKIAGNNLRYGYTKSCGCLSNELFIKRSYKHGATKNYKQSKEYSAWQNAKSRCYNKQNKKYKNYGAREIIMCERWKNDFSAFFKDLGKCPHKLTLGRINNDGNYEPKNCRWETNLQQSRNKTTNDFITYKGKILIQRDWAKKLNINNALFNRYLKRGLSIKEIDTKIKNGDIQSKFI